MFRCGSAEGAEGHSKGSPPEEALLPSEERESEQRQLKQDAGQYKPAPGNRNPPQIALWVKCTSAEPVLAFTALFR